MPSSTGRTPPGPFGRLPAAFLVAAAFASSGWILSSPAPAVAQDVPPPAAAAGETPSTSGTSGAIRPGDMIRVTVWRQPEFSGEFFVTEAGVVAHPLYRRIVAAGRSPEEVRGSFNLFLAEYETEPNFVVEVFYQVAVGGEVRQPNLHHLRPGTTVAEAVAVSGGISDRGALDRVILRRDGQQYRGDLTDPASEFRNVPIRSGDEIVVERRRDVFREYVVPIISVAGSIASIIRLANPGR
jgi:protein involved in polysaccharide export with SLBB domain